MKDMNYGVPFTARQELWERHFYIVHYASSFDLILKETGEHVARGLMWSDINDAVEHHLSKIFEKRLWVMKVDILSLRPTQFCAGMLEVQHRVERLQDMSKKQLKEYFDDRAVPVVKGPNDRLYMVDHHHLARACWEIGLKQLTVNIIADLSHLNEKAFWKHMATSGWVYPYDQLGNGPHDPKYLPESIRGLADDPFRGIAWLAREAGGYEKVRWPFVEFKWANFLRDNMKTHPNTHDMTKVMTEALKLCKGPIASKLKLPGVK